MSYYEKGGVIVDKKTLQTGSSSYPIRNISGLHVRKNSILSSVFIAIILLILFLCGIGIDLSEGKRLSNFTIFCGCFLLLPICHWIQPGYYLYITTSGRDNRVLHSYDLNFLHEVKEAVEDTIKHM